MKYLRIALMSILIIASLTTAYISFCIASISIGERIEFQDSTGQFEFTAIPSKGRDLEVLKLHLENYKKENCITEEVLVFRTSRKNYLKIKNWKRYMFQPEWQVKVIR